MQEAEEADSHDLHLTGAAASAIEIEPVFACHRQYADHKNGEQAEEAEEVRLLLWLQRQPWW